jgi:hypothetical protein
MEATDLMKELETRAVEALKELLGQTSAIKLKEINRDSLGTGRKPHTRRA